MSVGGLAIGGVVADSFVIAWFRRWGLAVWFAVFSLGWFVVAYRNGLVAAHDQYIVIARAWLAGANPYAVEYQGWFAAPPITLLPLVPFAVLPFGQWALLATSVGGGILTVRMLRLPAWWLLFPPLFIAMVGGGFDAWLVPLLLTRWAAVAVIAKAYAAVPLVLLGRWRPLAIAAIVTLVTWPLLPWPEYIADFAAIQGRLAEQAMDLSAPLWLAPVALVLLALHGRERAAWLAVPAMWPSTQLYYSVVAMPALGRMPILAACAAVPLPGLFVAGLAGQLVWDRVRRG
jgi:hypothetical protein